MDEKKKGSSVDDIFEEVESENLRKKKAEIDEIFEEFLPAPQEPIKKKKKVSDELLEEYLTPPPKIVEKKKAEEPRKEEKKAEEGLADFLIHPPVEEEKKEEKKVAPPRREPPRPEAKKPSPPPPPPKTEPSTPPAPVIKEVIREVPVKTSSAVPFLTGFTVGVLFIAAVEGVLWFAGPLKKIYTSPSSLHVVTVPVPSGTEKTVQEESKVEKGEETPPQPAAEEKPSQQETASLPPPPPPSEKYILTISGIKGDRELETIKEVLKRNNLEMSSVDKRESSKEVYEVYLDATYTKNEADAMALRLELLGARCTRISQGEGVGFVCGRYDALGKANEIRAFLSEKGVPARIRVTTIKEVLYTVSTVPAEKSRGEAVSSALRRFRVSMTKAP